jgi:hypothetical protein
MEPFPRLGTDPGPRFFTVVEHSVDRAGRRRDRKFKPPVFGQIQAAGDRPRHRYLCPTPTCSAYCSGNHFSTQRKTQPGKCAHQAQFSQPKCTFIGCGAMHAAVGNGLALGGGGKAPLLPDSRPGWLLSVLSGTKHSYNHCLGIIGTGSPRR